MRYVLARYRSQQRDLAYRIYTSDCLRMITESAAKQVGGSYMAVSYLDLIHPKKKCNKTGNEIVEDFIKKSGIKVV